jgi:hypothetical protein
MLLLSMCLQQRAALWGTQQPVFIWLHSLCSAMATALLATLTTQSETATSIPLGLEWMPIASILVPAVLLVAIIYVGSRNGAY